MSITEIKIDTPTTAEAEALAALTAPPSDFEALYNEKVAEVDRLNAVLTSARLASNTSQSDNGAKPAVTAARVKALVGNVGFLKLTRAEKLSSIGVDPSITDDFLRRIFGRGADGAVGSDLMKSSPARYRLLKEASLILDIYGK